MQRRSSSPLAQEGTECVSEAFVITHKSMGETPVRNSLLTVHFRGPYQGTLLDLVHAG
jgi:hypothetical protein